MEFGVYQGPLDAWAAHCDGVFGVGKEYFLRHFACDPWADRNGIFTAMDGEVIAATVRVFRREIYLYGDAVPMGGIGEVSTKPEYREQGLAGRLLDLTAAYMKKEGLAVSVLFSGANKLYSSKGWSTVAERFFRLDVSPAPLAGARLLTEGDLPALAPLYDAFSPRFDGAQRRTPEYWARWVAAEKPQGIVYEENGRPAAYAFARAHKDNNGWTLAEFGALPGREGMFPAMLCAAARLMGLSGPATVPAALLPDGRGYEEYGYMVRLILPFTAGGVRIDSMRELKRAFAEPFYWAVDHF